MTLTPTREGRTARRESPSSLRPQERLGGGNNPCWPSVDAWTRGDVLPAEASTEPWQRLAAEEERQSSQVSPSSLARRTGRNPKHGGYTADHAGGASRRAEECRYRLGRRMRSRPRVPGVTGAAENAITPSAPPTSRSSSHQCPA